MNMNKFQLKAASQEQKRMLRISFNTYDINTFASRFRVRLVEL